ncbi:uncharacterized protein LOC117103567 [Anneissia japonica]|uniref:uncharacterized protein LOC117103567 n=1 Tax=Anneissia japonica TaxID=1529436 RepID=UPI001425AED5|nr:uncharacterized protein LOC117103567 [Anneissia japonica]
MVTVHVKKEKRVENSVDKKKVSTLRAKINKIPVMQSLPEHPEPSTDEDDQEEDDTIDDELDDFDLSESSSFCSDWSTASLSYSSTDLHWSDDESDRFEDSFRSRRPSVSSNYSISSDIWESFRSNINASSLGEVTKRSHEAVSTWCHYLPSSEHTKFLRPVPTDESVKERMPLETVALDQMLTSAHDYSLRACIPIMDSMSSMHCSGLDTGADGNSERAVPVNHCIVSLKDAMKLVIAACDKLKKARQQLVSPFLTPSSNVYDNGFGFHAVFEPYSYNNLNCHAQINGYGEEKRVDVVQESTQTQTQSLGMKITERKSRIPIRMTRLNKVAISTKRRGTFLVHDRKDWLKNLPTIFSDM